ncbi:MAG TPA: 2-dehydropantoate 2-reductase, partial [Chloroflexi bacterium]|nr:2-dehydropantoate 2-reductase [Chloroflexota bacterium]
MKIAIIGIGAVGGVVAARLLAAGADVTLVAPGEQAARLR